MPCALVFNCSIETVANPRVEAEHHYYRAAHTRLLDLGVGGIVFPMIESAADAAAARASLRYPPEGTRGWGGGHIRRVRWTGPEGLRTAGYLEAANANVLSIFLIGDGLREAFDPKKSQVRA